MFGKKAKPRPSGNGKPRNNDLANLMGMGMPPMDDDEDESGLLAELAALQGKPAPAQKKAKPKQGLVSMAVIDQMAAEGMKDIDEMEDDSDVDENELLAELEDMSADDDDEDEDEERNSSSPQEKPSGNVMFSLLNERKAMYETAIQNAKSEGASSKVRRLDRGLKEIENLLKKAEKGASINEDDVPPPVATKVSKPIDPTTQTLPPPTTPKPQPLAPVPPVTSPEPPPKPTTRPRPPPPSQSEEPQPVPSSSTTNEETSEKLSTLLETQKQFKILALAMKKEGNMDEARKYLATSKQFDTVIQAVKEGKEVDLSNMPKFPTSLHSSTEASNMRENTQTSQVTQPPPPQQSSQPSSSATSPPQAPPSNEPPPAPKTVLEALQQRLAKYEEATQKAKEEGNGSKARRMGRIVKQYQDALKANKANKPFDYSELPAPPGFGPIPGVSAPANDDAGPAAPQPAAAASLTPPTAASQARSKSPATQAQPQQIVKSRNQKEYEFLVTRQKEFKAAALKAKHSGDLDSAREYLRQAKSLDEMILGAENGLRVDVTKVPSLKRKSSDGPQSSEPVGFKQPVTLTGSNAEQYVQLESALRKQIETSEKNCEHYKLLGNLDAAKNFESLFRSSTKDLETLLYYKKSKSPVPKCNYIMKSFPVVKSNPELSDSELEITIVRCVNVPLPSGWQPKDMHIYVTYEFPYPPEKPPQTGNTTTKKETVNPEFNESFKVMIDRKNRSFPRFCKRQSCNVKVYYVRGFLKGDKALGQASLKLEKFYNKCEIHESLDLVDLERGRKSVGGKIEILLKIREPLVDKDAEIVKEKWLVLDSHLRSLEMKTQSISPRPQVRQPTYDSLEVIKFEKELFEKQYNAYKSQGRQPPASLVEKIKACNTKSMTIQNKMKQAGKQGILDYYENLSKAVDIEKQKAQNALQNNDKESAKECLVKKKLLEKEIGVMRQRLGLK